MSLDAGLEELLHRADKRVLRVLSPVARCLVLALRFLRGGRSLSPEGLEAEAEGYGVRCAASQALGYLVELGLAECGPKGCSLTDEGTALSETLNEFLENLRRFAYKVLEGSIDESDVLAEFMTASASAIGLAEAYTEAPELMPLYLVMHAYVSGVSAAVLAIAARVDARILDMLENLLAGIEG